MRLNRDGMITLCSGVVGHVFGAAVVVALTLATVYVGSGVIGTENPAQSSSLPAVEQPAQQGNPKEASAVASTGKGSGEQPGGQAAEATVEPGAGADGAAVEVAYEEGLYEAKAEGYYDD